MIVSMATLQRIREGKRTALIRPRQVEPPFQRARQAVQVRRFATALDAAVDRERQVRQPGRAAVTDTLAWVHIIDQMLRPLGDLSPEDVARLGHPNLREFRRSFDTWDEDREVWFVTFELERQITAAPRLVARVAGYTSDAAMGIDEEAGEAVDEFTQRRYSEQGRERDDLREQKRREDYEARMLEERVKAIRLAHERGEMDASRLLAGIERRVKAAETKRRAA